MKCYLRVMGKENKKTYTYATPPSVREKAKKKAEKEGYTLSVRIDMFLREYTRTTKYQSVIYPNGIK